MDAEAAGGLRTVAAGLAQGCVAGVEPVAAEHELEQGAMLQREVHVGLAHGTQPGRGIAAADTADMGVHQVRQPPQATSGAGGEQATCVAEVVGRGGVRDASAARALAQREASQPLLPEQAFGGLDQGLAQRAVVVGVHGGWRWGRALPSCHQGMLT